MTSIRNTPPTWNMRSVKAAPSPWFASGSSAPCNKACSASACTILTSVNVIVGKRRLASSRSELIAMIVRSLAFQFATLANRVADRPYPVAGTWPHGFAFHRPCRAAQHPEHAVRLHTARGVVDGSIAHHAIRTDHEHGGDRDTVHFASVVEIPVADDAPRRVAQKSEL